ncbi:MAG: 1-phosphofructokinase family hexose kinase [Solobacterium sp.]|nr:1-phosphofructokinase family hexose kinase [Solobacterium sp.]
MIVTCTMNPSLDYYMESDQPIHPGHTNRSHLEYYEAGGKGINVSIVLNNLQVPTRACGFLGGFTKDFYITLLEKYQYIQPNFTYTNGHTRINVKFTDGEKETSFNSTGPYITDQDMENLMLKTNRLDEGDYFVLAGDCPEYLNESVGIMLERLMNDGVRVCLSTNPAIIEQALPNHPFLVKTRSSYVNEYVGRQLDESELIDVLRGLVRKGAVNVICTTKSGKEAYLACEEGVYHAELIHQEKAVSMIGSGDAMIAGFLMDSLRSVSPVESFRFGSCCSTATAYSKGFATRDKILSLMEESVVEKVAEI